MQRNHRLRAVLIALALVVGLAAAPSVAAKGRPLTATLTRTSCFDSSITITWWKKLTVRGVKVELFVENGTPLGAFAWDDPTGLTSPFSRSLNSGGSLRTYAVVSIYAAQDPFGLFGPAPTPIDSFTTPNVTFDCGI